jgi:hypothetical protein
MVGIGLVIGLDYTNNPPPWQSWIIFLKKMYSGCLDDQFPPETPIYFQSSHIRHCQDAPPAYNFQDIGTHVDFFHRALA